MRVTQKIRKACSIRLELLQPYIDTWQDALKVMAKPQNVPASLLNLSELIDEMWYLAGDRSFDMNWYSKRALLTGVYTSTEWYMTQDKSPNFVDTYNFLDRRLQDVGTIGKTASDIKGTAEFFKKTVQGIIESKSGMKF
ncbi:Ubiquinone biosynthesis protein coq9, mitochondrial [Lobulomyces angularis]|nr:Ubiquinone biosynthesis protein coq9, mitochondrial [Lobulomyces angularis]